MSRKRRYFMKQKLIGLMVIIGSVVFAAISKYLGCNDMTAPLLTIVIGVYLVVTRDMVWTDDYSLEMWGDQ